jgi:hypothetical protein
MGEACPYGSQLCTCNGISLVLAARCNKEASLFGGTVESCSDLDGPTTGVSVAGAVRVEGRVCGP